MDRTTDYGAPTARSRETGLLTRFVPDRLKHSALYRWILRLTRVLQFLSAAISLGLFSSRFYKVYRLVNSIKTRRGVNGYYGAVEGILAAAVVYTLVAMLMSLLLKGRGKSWLRWLWVLLDLAFVGGFIAVAVITRPNGGEAGPRRCYEGRDATSTTNLTGEVANSEDDNCNLPWGTFILAIVSTILHAITAAFHEVRDRYKQHRYSKESQAGMVGNGATGQQAYAQPSNGTYHAGNGINGAGHGTTAGIVPPVGNGVSPTRGY